MKIISLINQKCSEFVRFFIENLSNISSRIRSIANEVFLNRMFSTSKALSNVTFIQGTGAFALGGSIALLAYYTLFREKHVPSADIFPVDKPLVPLEEKETEASKSDVVQGNLKNHAKKNSESKSVEIPQENDLSPKNKETETSDIKNPLDNMEILDIKDLNAFKEAKKVSLLKSPMQFTSKAIDFSTKAIYIPSAEESTGHRNDINITKRKNVIRELSSEKIPKKNDHSLKKSSDSIVIPTIIQESAQREEKLVVDFNQKKRSSSEQKFRLESSPSIPGENPPIESDGEEFYLSPSRRSGSPDEDASPPLNHKTLLNQDSSFAPRQMSPNS